MDWQSLINFLEQNWHTLSQAPLTFLSSVGLGFAGCFFILKNRNETLQERLELREDQLTQLQSENKMLYASKAELEELKKKFSSRVQKDVEIQEYAKSLRRLEDLALAKEAYKMAEKLRRSVESSTKRQHDSFGDFHLESGLYNEWLSEGPKLFVIKQEVARRLPNEVKFHLDKISDSRYKSPAFNACSIIEQ